MIYYKMKRYYKIKSRHYNFIAKLTHRTAFVHPDIFIEFGNINNYCVIVTISSAYPQYPNINFVKYNKKCAMEKELDKNNGTVEMVKACLSFVNEAFSKINIKGFIFKDKSRIKEGNIKLPEYYIFKYGKTWYQQKFNAKPFDEITHTIHNKILEELEKCHKDLIQPWELDNSNNKDRMTKIDYDLFFKKTFDTPKNYENGHYNSKFKYVQEPAYNIAKPIYEKSISLYDFLIHLDDKTKEQFLNEWFHRHIYTYKNCQSLLDDNDWIILRETVESFPEIEYKRI